MYKRQLYHHSKELLERVLKFTRNLTKDYWLHIFGLPRMSLLQYYLHKIGVDSVDTSALLYLTARRRYLVGSKGEQVRTVDFKDCDCKGCSNLDPMPSTRSPDFFVNLYIHNILAAVKLVNTPSSYGQEESKMEKKEETEAGQKSDGQKRIQEPREQQPLQSTWMTAEESLDIMKRDREKQSPLDNGNDLSEFLQPDDDSHDLKENSD